MADLPNSYFTYETAAERLGVSTRLIRKLVAARRIKAVRIGACVRISPTALLEFERSLPVR